MRILLPPLHRARDIRVPLSRIEISDRAATCYASSSSVTSLTAIRKIGAIEQLGKIMEQRIAPVRLVASITAGLICVFDVFTARD